MKRQAGFTLIELVMVIVILGVLSAFALPRFADYGADARQASLAGLAGAIKSAASIAHAEQLIKGVAAGNDVTLEGEAIKMVEGYPQATADGIVRAANVSDSDYTISSGGAAAGTDITFTLKANCLVTYTSAKPDTSGAPGGSAAAAYKVAVTKSGC